MLRLGVLTTVSLCIDNLGYPKNHCQYRRNKSVSSIVKLVFVIFSGSVGVMCAERSLV